MTTEAVAVPMAGQPPRPTRDVGWVHRAAVATWMNVLVAVVVVTVVAAHGLPTRSWPPVDSLAIGLLKAFALWCLAFMPGWLYVRFLGLRAGALWNEYVLNLHRLGWDDAERLPRRPEDGRARARSDAKHNIYRQKFDAYYGRRVTQACDDDEDFRVSVETLFPVFVCTTVLAVGWAAVLWDTDFVVSAEGPWDALKFGFLGAYAFAAMMLFRRFFQSDLRPSAYAGVILRIVLSLLAVLVVHQLFQISSPGSTGMSEAEMITAFVIGFFPLIGLQAIQRVAAKALRVAVPQLAPPYPLDQLDGLNVWHEARLTEEGVEDMQNLATMNLVDVILHTRVPVGRLVDWVDQAFLLIHLEPVNRKQLSQARTLAGSSSQDALPTRLALRRVGVRTATDLIRVLPADGSSEQPIKAAGLDVDQIRLVAKVLRGEPALAPIVNWQQHGVAAT